MPNPLEPERETLRRHDWLTHVENKDPEYDYRWERFQGASGNSHIMRAKSEGYVIVKGDSPENPDNRDVNGHCTVSDVMLLKIKKDRINQIEEAQRREIAMKRGSGERDDNLARQLSEELSRKLGKPTNVVFSYQDPKDLANRRPS